MGYNPFMQIFRETIYLDFAATTPVDRRVLEKMLPFFSMEFGNTSSIHPHGQSAEAALEYSREILAEYLNCRPGEVLFTSGGTESDNLALRGVSLAARQQKNANHILVSSVEHPAISKTAQQLHSLFGFELELIPVDRFGMVHPEAVASRIRPETAIVSVIYANNEIGTINPIQDIGLVCRERGVAFHTDAVQAAAYLPVDVEKLNVDLVSLGAHKFYGPKGVGALYIRKGTPFIPLQTGGSQESGRRAGTHNTPYIVGLAEAFLLANEERSQRVRQASPLRDELIGMILEEIPESRLSGHPEERLPNHASFIFKNVDGNALLTDLGIHGFAVSSGSACKTGNPEPSEILLATGLDREWAMGSLRVTSGISTTPDQIQKFSSILPGIIEQQRLLRHQS
jgi:cysteine desulfurase